MKAISKKETYALYEKLTELAHALAAAQGTTPQNCQDPICKRWRRFNSLNEEEMADGYLLVLTDYDSPLFLINEKGIVDGFMNGGIMSVPAEGFKDVYRDETMLTVEYTDGTIEKYEAEEGISDVYKPHSSNRVVLPFGHSAN
jgi:hypothetical protein